MIWPTVEADLAIVKVVSDSTPKVGDVITWTITVTNNGPDRAVDVVVHDKLPDGLVYISDDSNGKYDDVSGVWTIGTLQNNASVTLNILSQVNIIMILMKPTTGLMTQFSSVLLLICLLRKL
ncbi:DUF11 domain-containing protein [uncultured Methanobrevibacter sp.]|uniref:DUF11 domain-containing protein n=1 Tax=uncultured Methanobrevibacter sp. TaxID=253161 RepID=UPI0025D66D21|nr:DUF11 domain-containing protein [uncultured Methanobrevibacter sp.]